MKIIKIYKNYVKLQVSDEIVLLDKTDIVLLETFPLWRVINKRVLLTRYLPTEYGVVRQDVHIGRAIVKPPHNFVVDHINRDPLDNRRCNLRLATASQNVINRAKSSGKTSKYHGVSLAKKASINAKKWRVFMRNPDTGKRICASFATEREAAEFYNVNAKRLWGDFAPQNKIERS